MNELADDFPIATVAEHFNIPISTLHYWERQGLLSPRRRAGRRCYPREQVYRVAVIQRWRATGLLNLTDIATVLNAHAEHDWRDVVTTRMADIRTQMSLLGAAHDYLGHLLNCRHDTAVEQCPAFRASVEVPPPGRP